MIYDKIQGIINAILKRYKSLGYDTWPITFRATETFTVSDLAPMCADRNCRVIYVDNEALRDLNSATAYFYLAHEIAHCLSNKDHEDKKFKEMINKYNSKFQPQTVSDPIDIYNKKLLPNFYKKDRWLDKAKSIKQFEEDIKTRAWAKDEEKKADYFPY